MSKYSIAIIDDEVEILNVLDRFLSRNGEYTVTTYSNPIHALESVIAGKFDIVLLDIMMPQMNGLEFLERVINQNENQKIIMMTAYSTLDKVLKSHKKGATDFVMKPFESLQYLGNEIQRVLKQ